MAALCSEASGHGACFRYTGLALLASAITNQLANTHLHSLHIGFHLVLYIKSGWQIGIVLSMSARCQGFGYQLVYNGVSFSNHHKETNLSVHDFACEAIVMLQVVLNKPKAVNQNAGGVTHVHLQPQP